MKKKNYVLLFLAAIIIFYSLYMILIIPLSFFYKETDGMITNVETKRELREFKAGRHQSGQYGYVYRWTTITNVYYKYKTGNTEYYNNRMGNILIFPTLEYNINDNVKVYYNFLWPEKSILFKLNVKYYFINMIPLAIMIIAYILLYNNKIKKMFIGNTHVKSKRNENMKNETDWWWK
jgi:hypothetical protein